MVKVLFVNELNLPEIPFAKIKAAEVPVETTTGERILQFVTVSFEIVPEYSITIALVEFKDCNFKFLKLTNEAEANLTT